MFEDPVFEAEVRETRWDRHLSRLPVCARCGQPIQGAQLVYIRKHEERYCLDCIDAMVEFNEEAEIE